jgi:hypothetical protein
VSVLLVRAGSHASFSDGGREVGLSQWFPGQFNEELARGGVGLAKIKDINERDEERVSPLDECGLLPPREIREGEEHGVTD